MTRFNPGKPRELKGNRKFRIEAIGPTSAREVMKAIQAEEFQNIHPSVPELPQK